MVVIRWSQENPQELLPTSKMSNCLRQYIRMKMVQTPTHFTCPFLKAIRLNVDLKSYFPNQKTHSSSNPHSRQQPQPVFFLQRKQEAQIPHPTPPPIQNQPFFGSQKKQTLQKTSPEKAGGRLGNIVKRTHRYLRFLQKFHWQAG